MKKRKNKEKYQTQLTNTTNRLHGIVPLHGHQGAGPGIFHDPQGHTQAAAAVRLAAGAIVFVPSNTGGLYVKFLKKS